MASDAADLHLPCADRPAAHFVPPLFVRAAGVAAYPAVGALVAACALLSACGSLEKPELPSALPATWSKAAESKYPVAADGPAVAPDLQGWWKVFDDPRLDALVEHALTQSLSLAQAGARLRAARRFADGEGVRFQPVLDGDLRTVQDVAAVDNYFRAGVDATWELGLFGLRQAVDQGARAHVGEAAAHAQAARISVVAEVVRHYLLLRAAQRDLSLQQRLTALDERLLALQAARARQRLGSLAQRQSVELRRLQTQAGEAAFRQTAAAAAQAIAVLLAETAPDVAWAGVDDSAGDIRGAPFVLQLPQVPADLLRFRPDVRLAEVEVERATGELGMARAALYPRVTLGLSYVYAYNITQNRRNVNSNLPSFGPAIEIPIFDRGRRRAAVDAGDETLQAALFGYRQALLEAFGETEVALSGLARARERVDRVGAAEQLLERESARQATRERLGLGDATLRLEAERAVLQAQAERSAAACAWRLAFVQLYKSLGGAPFSDAAAAVPSSAEPGSLPPAAGSP